MDQDSFRQLLQKPRAPGATPQLRGAQGASLLKQKASGSSAPTFKPRKVKKTELKYRDRAAERRDGGKSDYAQVEAVLENFEQRTANDDKDTVDEQRQYLGGDSEHTILVKGLDVSLLEQNKARAAASTEDDDTLEQAFLEASSEPTAQNKRTREDIIRELKAKRNGEGLQSTDTTAEPPEAHDLEKAKKAGKFKPIGFKPIGVQKDDKSNKKRSKEESTSRDKKRKKRKVEGKSGSPQPTNTVPPPKVEHPPTSAAEFSQVDQRPPSPLDDDMDIFAGAGDYEGFAGDGDSDEDGLDSAHKTESEHGPNVVHPSSEQARSRGWFGDEHDDEGAIQPPAPTESATPQLPPSTHTPQVDEEEEESLRLKPLESSALPSIRDFLAMDAAAEKEDKRKARKEKRKTKKKSDGDDDD
ncbi:RED-like protein N-terminal region-domain-containing protein [Suillus clintonianus]|uniref:RED-like protein N-terminal region-domain-containing protein n=1 Tax=Suillus clintonianus TaxID=1904413 RepID=UPI001B87F6C2|nr:RED-like protein N-terminal region-domain-containing protein [Suillus clintonianus]KAG2128571.1 RED-like protein N-terminal region-domain-containing protein [Suillus clintonianus]